MISTSSQALPLEPPRPVTTGGVEPLVHALLSETKLLGDLATVLKRQREGVASDNLDTVDDTVHGAQRVLLNMAQARRRRRALMDLLTGSEDASLGDLERALGQKMTQGLREARDGVLAAARAVSAELEINREILQAAIHSGEEYLRAIYAPAASAGLYGPGRPEEGARGSGGAFVNRQV